MGTIFQGSSILQTMIIVEAVTEEGILWITPLPVVKLFFQTLFLTRKGKFVYFNKKSFQSVILYLL